MTHQPDDRTPEERAGETQPRRPLDEEAAWAEIVANYGDRPAMGADQDDNAPGPFDRAYLDAQLARAQEEQPELGSPPPWDAEDHYVPPPPPPLPVLDPRRKAAWLGLFGSPLLMLIGIVLGWTYPAWLSFVLVVAFVGGFGYLVWTMPRTGGGDWSGDDGAVV